MTQFLSESEVAALLDMKEVVGAVEEVFRRVGMGQAVNSMRTRSVTGGSVLNVMHASLPYLGRAGLKCYLSTPRGAKFLVVLFDTDEATPLAIMGADMLGRYRTGAASAVATKHLYSGRSARLALFGTGRQALTQVLALNEVILLEEVRVWSPDQTHRREFASLLNKKGMRAVEADSPGLAASDCEVGCTITSSSKPFLDADDVSRFSHLNICGGNHPRHSEISAKAVGSFDTICVDDIAQAKAEYGDLMAAASTEEFSWEDAIDLGSIVAGKAVPEGRTMFKSGGVAIMDVAVANQIYEKAKSSTLGSRFDFS